MGLSLCIHRHITGSPVNVYRVSMYSLHLETAEQPCLMFLSDSSENIYCFLQEEHSARLRLNILLFSALFGCWNDILILQHPFCTEKEEKVSICLGFSKFQWNWWTVTSCSKVRCAQLQGRFWKDSGNPLKCHGILPCNLML